MYTPQACSWAARSAPLCPHHLQPANTLQSRTPRPLVYQSRPVKSLPPSFVSRGNPNKMPAPALPARKAGGKRVTAANTRHQAQPEQQPGAPLMITLDDGTQVGRAGMRMGASINYRRGRVHTEEERGR